MPSRITVERNELHWNEKTLKRFGHKPEAKIYAFNRAAKATRKNVQKFSFLMYIRGLFPIVDWLPNYKVRENFLVDFLAGLTIAVFHLPQGMAFGLLSGLSPINGLYVSFFPVLIYALMGTSRHISLGSVALTAILLRNALSNLGVLESDLESETIGIVNKWEAAATICITTGVALVIMGLLRLGSLSVLLSDQVVSGFLSGAAFFVATSQLKNMFGFSPAAEPGPFMLLRTWYSLITQAATKTNLSTFCTCWLAIGFLMIGKELVAPYLTKRFKLNVPIPVDLSVLLISTLLSFAFKDLVVKGNIDIMTEIPTGLPLPKFPRLDLIHKVFKDSIIIAVVSYSVGLSLSKTYAKKHKYLISPNQELMAMGVANIVSSFFSCYPVGVALARSAVLEQTGVKSMVAGFVSCSAILIVLLFLGPAFYHLPKAILSAITLVALKNIFLRMKDFPKSWRLSKFEGLSWISTFVAVILCGVDVGLLIGLFVNLAIVLVRLVM